MGIVDRLRSALVFQAALRKAYQGDLRHAVWLVAQCKELTGSSYVSPHVLEFAILLQAGNEFGAVDKFRMIAVDLRGNHRMNDATKNYLLYWMKNQLSGEVLARLVATPVFDPQKHSLTAVRRAVRSAFPYRAPSDDLRPTLEANTPG